MDVIYKHLPQLYKVSYISYRSSASTTLLRPIRKPKTELHNSNQPESFNLASPQKASQLLKWLFDNYPNFHHKYRILNLHFLDSNPVLFLEGVHRRDFVAGCGSASGAFRWK